jgi:hypothetical protein
MSILFCSCSQRAISQQGDDAETETGMTKEINRQQMSVAKPAKPGLEVDWELYGQYLEASDLSEADKREFIETLWSIVVSFVDLGFGLHPTQQTCGETIYLTALLGGDVVGSQDPKSTFNAAGDVRLPEKGGRS